MSFKGAYSDIVNLEMFVNDATGALVDIVGTDPRVGDWRHKAFVPARLPRGDARTDDAYRSGSGERPGGVGLLGQHRATLTGSNPPPRPYSPP